MATKNNSKIILVDKENFNADQKYCSQLLHEISVIFLISTDVPLYVRYVIIQSQALYVRYVIIQSQVLTVL